MFGRISEVKRTIFLASILLLVTTVNAGFFVSSNIDHIAIYRKFNSYYKTVVFEVGLLQNYSVQQYINIISQFAFTAAYVIPYTDDDVAPLLTALDTKNITVFLVAGYSYWVNWDIVNKYASKGYVMSIDDGGTQSQANLQKLKQMGLKTMLVCGYDSALRDMFNQGIVDYACEVFFPYYQNHTEYQSTLNSVVKLGQLCSETGVAYIPALQFFGKGALDWRFPNVTEIDSMVKDISQQTQLNGLIYFTPFSGHSLREETFDGFMDHPECWDMIKHS